MSARTVIPRPPSGVRSAGGTDPGAVRERNEDSLLLDEKLGVWAVADGMGGHSAGDVASRMVVEHLGRVRSHWTDARALAQDAVARLEDANAEIRAHADGIGATAGATVACLLIYDRHALAIWCGDSRVYRVRQGLGLERITRDHTVVQELVDAGELEEAKAESHPQAHVLTRAVGASAELELEFQQLDLLAGDRFLLCSDGLSREVPEAEILDILRARQHDPREACVQLLAAALAAGAPDNVTAIVVDLL